MQTGPPPPSPFFMSILMATINDFVIIIEIRKKNTHTYIYIDSAIERGCSSKNCHRYEVIKRGGLHQRCKLCRLLTETVGQRVAHVKGSTYF